MRKTAGRPFAVYEIEKLRVPFASHLAVLDRNHALANLTLFQQEYVEVWAIASEQSLTQGAESRFELVVVQRSHLFAQDLDPRTALGNLESCRVDVILRLAFLLDALVAACLFVHRSKYASLQFVHSSNRRAADL